MLSEEQRINYYLGELAEGRVRTCNTLPDAEDMPNFHYTTTVEDILDWEPDCVHEKFGNHAWLPGSPEGSSVKLINRYSERLKELLVYGNNLPSVYANNKIKTGRIAMLVGDGYSCNTFPVLTPYSNKTKRVDMVNGSMRKEEKSGVCLKFLYSRWWQPMYDYMLKPVIPFNEKHDRCVWRGATSGQYVQAGNRFTLLEKWYNRDDDIDIAFLTSRVRNRKEMINDIQKEDIYKPVTKQEWSSNKYIISSPGNMNESGLHWKLASNSVILMAQPEACTWLMEDQLVPREHYVRVKDDWSDLKEMIDWCRSHQKECEQIAVNAREYVSQFTMMNREKRIEAEVLRRYITAVNN
jgi:hypothetical protein